MDTEVERQTSSCSSYSFTVSLLPSSITRCSSWKGDDATASHCFHCRSLNTLSKERMRTLPADASRIATSWKEEGADSSSE